MCGWFLLIEVKSDCGFCIFPGDRTGEFKFLNRALSQDGQLDLVGLIRIANREAKFDFRGREGETSNSLFRGFKKRW